ncbi:hypothetical protein BN159_8448 [Streptomyces davaonensis JCM 4913]|uniref:Uncharacterized protein n=1 Tax=Streptomyces davaonensis (strain DSM 101723 / JCM 4913 / KCC S-0913 / 768) TaxID=1214101 RepID=K4R999_STRDJ|nr:hypothetical protein BN159_8448 [Streptomyces davaonensis JCM 4913]
MVVHRRSWIAAAARGREPRTTLPSTAITRRTGPFSVSGSTGGGVLACRYALIAASSASPSTRCSRRRTVVACGTGRRPVSGSAAKPRTPSTCCGASVIHSLIAMSERAPVSTAETAAHNNATAGYRSPRTSRGSATRIRKRRRSATSLGVRGSVGEPSCSSAEGMGDDVRAGTVSLGSHGSRQPHDHQHRACSAFPDPLPCNRHDATSLTRPANRTNPNHAMPLMPIRTCAPCGGAPSLLWKRSGKHQPLRSVIDGVTRPNSSFERPQPRGPVAASSATWTRRGSLANEMVTHIDPKR